MVEYPYHELADIFPLLHGREYDELVEDIRQRGLLESIWLYENKILDGRNRYRACKDAGVEPRYQIYEGGDPLNFVVSMNIMRRHLSSSQRATLAVEVLPRLEAEAKERQIRKPADSVQANLPEQKPQARDEAAALMQVSGRNVQTAKKLKEEAPDLFDQVRAGETTINKAAGKLRQRKAKAKKIEQGQFIESTAPSWRLFPAPVEEIHNHIAPGSVDVVITDPPYPEEYLPLFGTLAEQAKLLLKPGGLLVTMAPQPHLPRVFDLMLPHLDYLWLGFYRMVGKQSRQFGRHMYVNAKPLLFFTNGKRKGKMLSDVIDVPKIGEPDKDLHDWGQSVLGLEMMVEKYSEPGDCVLDPFLGAGSTALACVKLRRFIIGSDIDPLEIEKTKGSIHEMLESNDR